MSRRPQAEGFKFFVVAGMAVVIIAVVFLLGFFNWVATYKAVQNDDRRKQGLPPLEKVDDEKVLVWPLPGQELYIETTGTSDGTGTCSNASTSGNT